MITRQKLAAMIDHTNLKAYATEEDFKVLCRQARDYGFAMVAINSYPVKMCKKFLAGSNVHVGAAIAFPLGQMSIEAKLAETADAIKNGCDEIDYVLNVGKVKEHDYSYIEEEMSRMKQLTDAHGIILKVILENCYLDKEEIVQCCLIARKVKPDFVKTSTGFGTSGATVEDVRLMKQTVGDEVKVKAAGGIRDLKTAMAMIEAGAERIGTSSGIEIIRQLEAASQS